jgi:hypothetical protein|tara:strand:- start:1397 stop:1588 length:192 start_codon:yes stop_codon:yes gene_type:complete
MFKLFNRKTIEGVNLDDDINYDLDISPVPDSEYNEFQELSLNECFAVILERLDNIEAKIDKIK